MKQRQKSEIKKELMQIKDEAELRNLLHNLLCKKCFERVKITHGSNENGKDIVCSYEDKFNRRTWISMVVKVGSIVGNANATGSTILNIKNQIELSFSMPYYDLISLDNVFMNKVYVVTNGNISKPAQDQIQSFFSNRANIEFWDISYLTDLVFDVLPEYFVKLDLYIYDYYNLVCSEFEKINELKSFHYSKEIKKLLEIFIEPTLVAKKKVVVENLKSPKSPIKYEFVKANDLTENLENYFIVGESGAGKSTLFRKMILEVIESAKYKSEYIKLPILIRFKDIIEMGGVKQAILNCVQLHNVNNIEFNLDEKLYKKEIILFVDSLDEIPKEEEIEKALKLLNEFEGEHKITIIASSRDIPTLNENSHLNIFKRYDIMKLDHRQITQFLDKWFSKDQIKKNRLLQSLKDTEILNKLPKTPLVLTLIAILFDESEQEIPANLTELYSMFTELLLGRWDSERNIESFFKYELKDKILRLLAVQLHSEKEEEITRANLVALIDEYTQDRGITIQNSQFIEEIEKRSQLLFKNSRGNYQFKHLSFQEYFVAKEYFETRVDTSFTYKMFLETWWQEGN